MGKREWMIEARREKGFKRQNQFAEAVGLSKNYLSAIENGERTPSGKAALKIAKALDIPMERFFEEDQVCEKVLD
jgi:putative transcriptional regulator